MRVFYREALLSAAASGALNSAQDKVNNNNQTIVQQPQKHVNNNLMNNQPAKGQINKPTQPQKVNNGVQRKPSTSSIPEKKRETIWDFFEQGNKKGTCR